MGKRTKIRKDTQEVPRIVYESPEKTVGFTFRLNIDDLNKFKQKCREEHNVMHSTMMRFLIVAFNDDRMTIEPTKGDE